MFISQLYAVIPVVPTEDGAVQLIILVPLFHSISVGAPGAAKSV